MKKSLLALSLVIIFSAQGASASCLDKGLKTNAKLSNILPKVYNQGTALGVLIFAPFISTSIAPAYLLSTFPVEYLTNQFRATLSLLSAAREANLVALSEFQSEISSMRPDLSVERLREILVEVDQKELICKTGLISGPLLRNLIISGDVENAIETSIQIDTQEFIKDSMN